VDSIDLEDLFRREGDQVECKYRVGDTDKMVRTLIAFSNDYPHNLGGGYVVCGAREEKDEHGFQKVLKQGLSAAELKRVKGKVHNSLRKHAHPSIVPRVFEMAADTADRRILVFAAPRTGNAHCFRETAEQSGAYWVRQTSDTRLAQNGLLLRLLAARGERLAWYLRPAANATPQDIDLLALRDTLVRLGVYKDAGVDAVLRPGEGLHALVPSLCEQEPLGGPVRPRNFALLLFGREPQAWADGAYVTFSVYNGVDRSAPLAIRHQLLGTVLQQAEALLAHLEAQAPDLFDKGGPTENLQRFHRRALKEVAINALAHRDYEAPGPVRVTVFADRVEIKSPGGLPVEVDEDEFQAGRASAHWRNMALAWFFERLDLAQSEGQGVATVLRLLPQQGYRPAVFNLTPDWVAVTLWAHPRSGRRRSVPAGLAEDLILQGAPIRAQLAVEALVREAPNNPDTWRLALDGWETFRTAGWQSVVASLIASDRDYLPPAGILARVIRQETTDGAWLGRVAERRFPADGAALVALALMETEHELWLAERVLEGASSTRSWRYQVARALVSRALRERYGTTAALPSAPPHVVEKAKRYAESAHDAFLNAQRMALAYFDDEGELPVGFAELR
jgi:ATP-dependent DNA helicase RecG